MCLHDIYEREGRKVSEITTHTNRLDERYDLPMTKTSNVSVTDVLGSFDQLDEVRIDLDLTAEWILGLHGGQLEHGLLHSF